MTPSGNKLLTTKAAELQISKGDYSNIYRVAWMTQQLSQLSRGR